MKGPHVKWGFVAQMVLRPDFPLPQMDSAYSLRSGNAKTSKAVLDWRADLDIRNLPVEVVSG